MAVAPSTASDNGRHRPKWITVFAAAFVAGATAAVGVNSFLDAHLARRKPQVECEPIFVALRSLPQGAPVTVWDVALKDWPKAMLPAAALRAHDSFDGFVLRHAIREGQPLLAVQLVRADAGGENRATAAGDSFTAPIPATQQPAPPSPQADLWAPAEAITERKPASQPKPEDQGVALAPAPTGAGEAQAGKEPPAVSALESVSVDARPAIASTDIDPPKGSADRDDNQPVISDVVAVAQPISPSEASAAPAVAVDDPTVPPPAPVAPESARLEPPAPQANPLASAPIAPAPADVDSPALAATQQPAGEPTPAPDISKIPSVVVPDTEARASQDNPASTGSSGRFLVVPERIALQADTSFVAPRRPQPPAVASQPRVKQQPPRAAAGTRRENPARGQQPQQPRPATKTSMSQRTWGSFFPNIAAGMDALGGQSQRSRSSADQKPPARR